MNLHSAPGYLKDGIKNIKLPFNQDEVWIQIENRMQKNKKRRAIVFWFSVGLFIVSVGTFMFEKNQNIPDVIPVVDNYQITNEFSFFSEPKISPVKKGTMNLNEETNNFVFDRERFDKKNMYKGKDKMTIQKFVSEYFLSPENIIISEKAIRNDVDRIAPIQYLPLSKNFVYSINISKPSDNVFETNRPKGKKSNRSVCIGGVLGLVLRELSVSESNQEAYRSLNQIQETEKILEQAALSVQYQKMFSKNWYFTVGLHYRQIAEKFQFNTLIREKWDSYGDIESYRVRSFHYKYYNSYRFIDVSAGLGYIVPFHRCSLFFDVSFSKSLISSFSGTYLSSPENAMVATLKNEKIGDQYQIVHHAGLQWDIRKNIQFYVAEQITLGMTPFTRSDSEVNKNLHIFSLNTGFKLFY
jgi:hypothetical protein